MDSEEIEIKGKAMSFFLDSACRHYQKVRVCETGPIDTYVITVIHY